MAHQVNATKLLNIMPTMPNIHPGLIMLSAQLEAVAPLYLFSRHRECHLAIYKT